MRDPSQITLRITCCNKWISTINLNEPNSNGATCSVTVHPHLHEEHVVPPGIGHHLLHLPAVHSQGLLTQNILLGLHEDLADLQVVGMDDSDIDHIFTHTHTNTGDGEERGKV